MPGPRVALAAAEFTAASYPVEVSAGQTSKHVIAFQALAVECNTANFTATLSAPSPTIELTPAYSGCKAFGFLNMTMNMNGCKYKLSIGTGSADNYTGGEEIVCPSGKEIVITASTCTLHIPSQSPTTNAISYKNETGSPNKALIGWSVAGIHSNVSAGFLCPLESTETDTTGEYSGTTLLTAANGVTSFDIG